MVWPTLLDALKERYAEGRQTDESKQVLSPVWSLKKSEEE